MLYVTNKSTVVSDADVLTMTRACARQLKLHAAPLWSRLPVPVVYTSSPKDAAPGSVVIAVLDDSDQAGALGWHTEDSGDVEYGRVFAKPVLDNGGDALTKPLSVASVLSHEVLEWFIDPHVNLWADSGHGKAYSLEVCDPVESDSYVVQVGSTKVTVSNFVTPSWFDTQAASTQQFDYLGKVSGPFHMTPGGYVVTMSEGKVAQTFGDKFPEWKKQSKMSDLSRYWRRV